MFADAEIVDRCRSHLEALPGVRRAAAKTPVRSTALPVDDLGLTLETDVGTLRYSGAAKRRLTSSQLDHWLLLALPRQQRHGNRVKLILFADYVSPAQAQRLRDAEVDYVDTVGNLLIHEPGKLYLFKSGGRPERHGRPRPGRLFMPSGLQVLFVLLIEPSAVDLPYRELALQSGVALGSIAVLMKELKRQGYLVPGQKRARLVRRHELLDRWVAGYGERLRPKLVLGVFSAAERDPTANLERLAAVLRERQIAYAVTGGVDRPAAPVLPRGGVAGPPAASPRSSAARLCRAAPSRRRAGPRGGAHDLPAASRAAGHRRCPLIRWPSRPSDA